MPVRSRHYCEEPGRVLVWITARRLQMLQRVAYTFVGILCNLSHERRAPALRSLILLSSLSSNTTNTRTLARPRGGQDIQAWTLRTAKSRKGGRKRTHASSTRVLHPSQERVILLVSLAADFLLWIDFGLTRKGWKREDQRVVNKGFTPVSGTCNIVGFACC